MILDMKNYYAVYLRKTDELVACGTSAECVRQMGLKSVDSFYCLISHVLHGLNRKYEVYKEKSSDLEV